MRFTEYFLPFASELVSQHNVTCEPLVVQFSRGQVLPQLRVDLKLVNTPTCDGLDYKVVIYCKKDGLYTLKSTPKTGSECNPTVPFEHRVTKNLDKCYIAYCSYNEKKQSCELGKDQLYNLIILHLTEAKTHSDCIANKCELTLDVKNYCKRSVPSTHPVQEYKDTPTLFSQAIPSGDYESRVVITCSAAGQKFDLLYLYQKRTEEHSMLLKIVQYLKDEEGEITLSLNKTVSVYDKGSTIYCVKRKPDNLSYEKRSDVKGFREGDYKYVDYQPLDRNTSELEVPDASSQQYNRSTNDNTLTLLLNGSYDSKTLFCAQDSHLVVQHASGRRSVARYGDAATSRNITLKLQKETDVDVAPTGSGPDPGLVCGVVGGIAALLAAAAFVAWRRRRAAGEGGAPEENQYATIAEVTYAELALKESAGAPKTQESSPYAQIVGVYNPRK